MTEFFDNYINLLTAQYPSTQSVTDLRSRMERLISDKVVQLPLRVYTRAQQAVQKIESYSQSDKFLSNLRKNLSPYALALFDAPTKNRSVLMCYDFHYNQNSDNLALIEINTNASSFLFTELLYRLENEAGPWGDSLAKLKHSFLNELSLCSFRGSPRVAIVDENVLQQKMYVEFLMYRDLFESWGWEARIYEHTDVPLDNIDFIYNRLTDFTLSEPTSQPLRRAYINGDVIFSPHPREYLRLADKQRLIEFARSQVSETILPVFELGSTEESADSIWDRRKKLFFKPKNLFGGKAVYRGSSISRRKFDEIFGPDYIAQEYSPPGEWDGWKFDLRFYVYENQIQLGVARLYQGQVTNFNTLGGGISRLKFVSN